MRYILTDLSLRIDTLIHAWLDDQEIKRKYYEEAKLSGAIKTAVEEEFMNIFRTEMKK